MRIAVILAGCGYLDGAEIREAVLALTFLDKHGADVGIYAPDIAQHHTVDHLTGNEMVEPRNVLTESARIARGAVSPLSALDVDAYDAVVLPGGFGVAKNVSDLAFKGANVAVLPQLNTLLQAFHAKQKPIGAICIAPAIVARALAEFRPVVTVGDDGDVPAAIRSWGAQHQECATQDVCIDAQNRIVSCSAYMRDDALWNIAQGIEKLVFTVKSLCA